MIGVRLGYLAALQKQQTCLVRRHPRDEGLRLVESVAQPRQDVFHDREERVAIAALDDAQSLETAGYGVVWLRRLPSIYTAEVKRGSDSTRLEWVVDSDYRFFPTVKDDTFGYVLHPVDLAMNKTMAAAGRREVRDVV